MEIRIGEKIAKYRKKSGVTQNILAEYLGVTPQAVSKWEMGESAPDIYLIPKMASFFDISTDLLFGVSDLERAKLLVGRYSVQKGDKNYREAREMLDTILDAAPQDLFALQQLCRLEYLRATEYLQSSRMFCQKLEQLAKGQNHEVYMSASVQLIRENIMLGIRKEAPSYREQFEQEPTVDHFNLLLVEMGNLCRYEEMLRLGEAHLKDFTLEEQGDIAPNLLEAAYQTGDIHLALQYFNIILEQNKDVRQVFNAWWLLWKTYQKLGNEIEAEKCQRELLALLPKQKYNDYVHEQIFNHLNGCADMAVNAM